MCWIWILTFHPEIRSLNEWNGPNWSSPKRSFIHLCKFATDVVIRSNRSQKKFCREFKELSNDIFVHSIWLKLSHLIQIQTTRVWNEPRTPVNRLISALINFRFPFFVWNKTNQIGELNRWKFQKKTPRRLTSFSPGRTCAQVFHPFEKISFGLLLSTFHSTNIDSLGLFNHHKHRYTNFKSILNFFEIFNEVEVNFYLEIAQFSLNSMNEHIVR